MATKNSKYVHVPGFSYKQAIAGTFGITLSNKFLPMQLIYGRKTAQSLPKFKFPESLSLSANPKHFSNTTESLKLLDEIIILYVKNEREQLKLEPSQPALLILDAFSGQMTTPVTDKLAENHIKYVKVPANMTNLFQPLDLTINRSTKAFMKKKLTEWYSLEVMKQLHSGKKAEEIEVKLFLPKLKSLHASWLIELCNHFTSTVGKEIIANGLKAAGITDTIKNGSSSLDPLSSFSTNDLLEQPADDEIFGRQITYPTKSSTNFERGNEDKWVFEDSLTEDRNIFDIFDDK